MQIGRDVSGRMRPRPFLREGESVEAGAERAVMRAQRRY